jgi:deoxyribonuclease V
MARVTELERAHLEPVALVDVHYGDQGALAACVVARRWTDASPCEERTATSAAARPYEPGAFFQRELPCIVQVLALVRARVASIVIDGYVDLDERGTPGLGAHLYAHLGGETAVVGVAKTAYRMSAFAAPVLRGTSKRPLFVTARGVPLSTAARLVEAMQGDHRIPVLLARVDRLSRGAAPLADEAMEG